MVKMVQHKGAMVLLMMMVTVLEFFAQEVFAAQVNVDKKEQTVLVGDEVTFMCQLGVKLQYCRVEIPGLKSFNLNQGISNQDVAYYGNGLDAGQCGFKINQAKDVNNGEIKCYLGVSDEAQESVGTMSLVVARAPKAPELDLSRGADQLNVYRVDDILQAFCIVKDGRPVANLSWFLDDEPIDNSELSLPTVYDLAKENLHSQIQNLTRRLRSTDNGKFLRCVATHPAYPDRQSETKRQLNVEYAPIPQKQTIEVFGYEVGKIGVINVTVQANPKPRLEWKINGQVIREGSTDNTGSIQAEPAEDLGNSVYVAMLRIARITKQDTEKDYILTAYNDLGNEAYRVKISTNPEPQGYEFGVAAIIGIIVAIMITILVVSVLVFAKINGKWCFNESVENKYIAESDTESADIRPKEKKRRLASLKFDLNFLRNKNHDKVASSEESPSNIRSPNETDEADTNTLTAEDRAKEIMEKNTSSDNEKGLVYAELDLVRPKSPQILVPVLKNNKNNDKTEYAEIIYAPAINENNAPPNFETEDKIATDTNTTEKMENKSKAITDDNKAEKNAEKDDNKGLVYAELGLVQSKTPKLILVPSILKVNKNDKTEYAKIIYAPGISDNNQEIIKGNNKDAKK